MKLNDEQRVVVEENHKLIYWYAHRRNLDLEEWYGLLAIELCKTVVSHDSERGTLSTYYKIRCDNLVNKEYNKSKAKKNTHNGITTLDNIQVGYEPCIEEQIECIDFLTNSNEILYLRYLGYTQMEIAEKLGVTQSYISKILGKMKEEYYENR